MWRLTPGPQRSVPAVCRIACSIVRGLSGNHSDLAVAWSVYDILLSSETFFTDIRHMSELLVPGFGSHLVLPSLGLRVPRDGCKHARWIRSISPTQI